jgi:SAM-dependent methyltransferase
LLRDFAEKDTNEFHRFLWSNHLAYAETYEIDQRFGEGKLQTTRRILIADLNSFLQQRGINPATDINSVFDVGCSLGYLLRFLETDICQSASVLRGLDIDRYAIETGSKYLHSIGSKVEIFTADMTDAQAIMGPRKYDLVFCCGVLNYLDEPTAATVVRIMLQHTGRFLVIKDRANPEQDNHFLTQSIPRPEGDGSMVHNLDRMLVEAGGDVIFRRWEGPQVYDTQSVYNLIAEPRNSGCL